MRCSKTGALVHYGRGTTRSGDIYQCPQCHAATAVATSETFHVSKEVEWDLDLAARPSLPLEAAVLRAVQERAGANGPYILTRLYEWADEYDLKPDVAPTKVHEILRHLVDSGVISVDEVGYYRTTGGG